MILFFGDSHSEVLGPAIKRKLGADFVDFTWPHDNWPRGKTAADYVATNKLTDATIAGATHVVLELGTNDGLHGASKAALRQTLTKLADAAANAGATLVWIGPPHVVRPDVAQQVDDTANILRDLCKELDIPFMDSRPVTQTGHYDGVHYHNSAYAIWADAIAAFLRATITEIA